MGIAVVASSPTFSLLWIHFPGILLTASFHYLPFGYLRPDIAESSLVFIRTGFLDHLTKSHSDLSVASFTRFSTSMGKGAERFFVVKTPLQAVGWSDQYRDTLEQLVCETHELTVHAYQLARWIFVRELHTDQSFDLNGFVNEIFFQEVFLHLTKRKARTCVSDARIRARQIVRKYLDSYKAAAKPEVAKFTNYGQIANYTATTIKTAYLNNVALRFGEHLRCVVNCLAKRSLTIGMGCDMCAGASGPELCCEHREQHRAQVRKIGRQVKAAIKSRHWKQAGLCDEARAIVALLEPIRSAYPESYEFAKDSIYYDAKANPDKHLKAYYQVMKICEDEKIKAKQCFPLRTSWVPGHMQIDTRILRQKFVTGKLRKQKSEAENLWGAVVNYNAKPFKARGNSEFSGSIVTDGVSVSVLRKITTGKATSGSSEVNDSDDCRYIEDIPSSELAGTAGRCVLIDPGRRDLLFCMKETSTPEQPEVYRYTANQKAKETRSRRFRKLRETVKKKCPDG
ncbi:hypothetical protein GQ54DRAFT_281088, partial [Martensiomyces pterosporus]